MNMIELESGTLELADDRWQNLRRVLEVILPYWIDSTKLNGKGIQLFLLKDSSRADFGQEKFPSIIVIKALREREADPKTVVGYAKLGELHAGIYPDVLIGELQKIFEDHPRMKLFWQEENRRTRPEANLGQGDGCFQSYRIVFSTEYYNTFLRLYLSHHYTSA